MNIENFPLVSIVAPNYNHSSYIGACLDSIMFQDYPHIELIIIDDASSDNSPDVIDQFLYAIRNEKVSFASYYNSEHDKIERSFHNRYKNDGRSIIYIKNEKNIGSTATYNLGMKNAKGTFCTFVATDDICHPQFVSTMVQNIISTNADFAYADMFIIDDAYRILREFKLPDYSFKKCFADWYLCGVATLYRLDLHHRFGWYDEESNADDHECYLRFALGGARFVHVDKSLYSVRSHHTRKVGLHSPERFKLLLEESCQLTIKARNMHLQGASHG